MGLGDFFKRRARRESAVPASQTEVEPLGSFAASEGQPVVGQQVGGGGQQFSGNLTDLPGMIESLGALAQLGPMIQKAMAEGNMTQNPDGSYSIGSVTVNQGGAQTIDLRGADGSELREQILGILGQHGIDPENPAAQGQSVDPSAYTGMQQQIMDALAQHGIDATGGQIEPPKDD